MPVLPPECDSLPEGSKEKLQSFYNETLPTLSGVAGARERKKAANALKNYLKRLQYFGVYESDEVQWVEDLDAAQVAHQASVKSATLDESRELALKSIKSTAEMHGRLEALSAVLRDVRNHVLNQQQAFFAPQDCANAADDASHAAAWLVVKDLQLEPSPFDPLIMIWKEGFWPIGPLAGKFVIYSPPDEEMARKMLLTFPEDAQVAEQTPAPETPVEQAPTPQPAQSAGVEVPQASAGDAPANSPVPSGDGWSIPMSWTQDDLPATDAAPVDSVPAQPAPSAIQIGSSQNPARQTMELYSAADVASVAKSINEQKQAAQAQAAQAPAAQQPTQPAQSTLPPMTAMQGPGAYQAADTAQVAMPVGGGLPPMPGMQPIQQQPVQQPVQQQPVQQPIQQQPVMQQQPVQQQSAQPVVQQQPVQQQPIQQQPVQTSPSQMNLPVNQYQQPTQPIGFEGALEQTDMPELKKSSGMGLWVFLFLLIAGGGGGAYYYVVSNSASAFFARAQELIKKGNYLKAAPVLQDVLKKEPGFKGAHRLLGDCFWQMNQEDKALTAYQKATTANPGDGIALRNLGILLRKKGRLEEAQVQLSKASSLLSADLHVWANLGNVQARLGKLGKATKSLKQALRIKGNFSPALNDLGSIYLRQAQTAMQIAATPKEIPPQAMALLQDAERAYRKAIQSDKKAVYFRNLGDTLSLKAVPLKKDELKQQESLITQAYTSGRNTDPNEPSLLNNFGVLLLKQTEYTQAIPLLQKAVDAYKDLHQKKETEATKKQLASALYNFGVALEGNKQHPQSIVAYQQYLRLYPQDGDVYCRLAKLFRLTRKRTKARLFSRQCRKLSK